MSPLPIPILVKDGRPILWRFFLLLGLAVSVGVGSLLGLGLAPACLGAGRVQAVEIAYGTGIGGIATLLRQRGLVRSSLAFKAWAKLAGSERAVKAGTYALAPSMSVPRILAVLTGGRELVRRVTIPEGSTVREIADFLDEQGLIARATFLARAVDPVLVREVLPEAGTSLEGFLFPDTYFFSTATGADGVIRMMTKRFSQVMTPAMRARVRSMGWSLREIAIVASIVEREAKRPEDRPLIASVFYNRLRAGIALQSCATVQYALGKHKQRLLYEDLSFPSPYNTYLNRGLPPGPICNPGLASIRAALYPAPGRYLYFVARSDGTHIFSETYRDHLRAQREIAGGR